MFWPINSQFLNQITPFPPPSIIYDFSGKTQVQTITDALWGKVKGSIKGETAEERTHENEKRDEGQSKHEEKEASVWL